MKKYITFGNWNKSYLYIIASFASLVLFNVFEGFGYYFYGVQLLSDPIFNGHIYIHKLYYYLFIFICSSIYRLYKKIRNKNKIIKDDPKGVDELAIYNNIELIHITTHQYTNKKISNIFVLFIIFLYVIFDTIDTIVHQYFAFGDFWMVELWIMVCIYKILIKAKIYKHQLVGICIVLIPFLLKLSSIDLFFYDENNYLKNGQINYKYNSETTLLKSLFVAHAWLLLVSFIFYFITMTLESYIVISIKNIMDLKYIPISKILILYGGFGTIFTAIFSLITAFIS